MEAVAMIEARGQDGTIMFDGHGVHVVRKGFVARQQHGRGGQWFPIGSVTGVDFVFATTFRRGSLTIRDSGGATATVRFLSRQAAPFERVCEALQYAIAELDARRAH